MTQDICVPFKMNGSFMSEKSEPQTYRQRSIPTDNIEYFDLLANLIQPNN